VSILSSEEAASSLERRRRHKKSTLERMVKPERGC
jgi:hypothetical protein